MTKPTDVMIDLETLGTKPGCVVLSIGACSYNRFSGEIFETFYAEINRAASHQLGLESHSSTIDWWNKQGEEARMFIARTGTDESLHPSEACRLFSVWMENRKSDMDIQGVWANDPTFDCAILSHVFSAVDIETPWPFRAERSCRTAVDIGLILGINPKKTLPFFGVPHHALDDAKHQAQYVSTILQVINSQVAYTASLEEDKRSLISDKTLTNTFHTEKMEQHRNNLIELLTTIRDSPDETTRLACVNSTIEKLAATKTDTEVTE